MKIQVVCTGRDGFPNGLPFPNGKRGCNDAFAITVYISCDY